MSHGVVKETKSQGLGKAMFSGEGLFVHRISGVGVIFVTSLGAIIQRQLRQGEQWIVDNGHLVAWNCPYAVERTGGGIMSGIHAGEGLVCRFTGPGTVFIQVIFLEISIIDDDVFFVCRHGILKHYPNGLPVILLVAINSSNIHTTEK